MSDHLSTERLDDAIRVIEVCARHGGGSIAADHAAALLTHIDAQAATIQRVRDVADRHGKIPRHEAFAYEITRTFDGGQE